MYTVIVVTHLGAVNINVLLALLSGVKCVTFFCTISKVHRQTGKVYRQTGKYRQNRAKRKTAANNAAVFVFLIRK